MSHARTRTKQHGIEAQNVQHLERMCQVLHVSILQSMDYASTPSELIKNGNMP